MKIFPLFLISVYQVFLSSLLHALTGTSHACRYQLRCSEYMRKAIEKYGVLKGSFLGLKRLSTCHPFARYHWISD